jgi:hypothetical protein
MKDYLENKIANTNFLAVDNSFNIVCYQCNSIDNIRSKYLISQYNKG